MLTHSLCHLSVIVTIRICDLQACGEQDMPPSSPQSLPPPAGVYILVRDTPKLGLCLLGLPLQQIGMTLQWVTNVTKRKTQCLQSLEEGKDCTQGRDRWKAAQRGSVV